MASRSRHRGEGAGLGERGLPRDGHGSLGAVVGRAVGRPKAQVRARSSAQQTLAPDAGEWGAVAGDHLGGPGAGEGWRSASVKG